MDIHTPKCFVSKQCIHGAFPYFCVGDTKHLAYYDIFRFTIHIQYITGCRSFRVRDKVLQKDQHILPCAPHIGH